MFYGLFILYTFLKALQCNAMLFQFSADDASLFVRAPTHCPTNYVYFTVVFRWIFNVAIFWKWHVTSCLLTLHYM